MENCQNIGMEQTEFHVLIVRSLISLRIHYHCGVYIVNDVALGEANAKLGGPPVSIYL